MGEYVSWFFDAARWSGSGGIPARTVEHLVLTGATMVLACLIALPLGIGLGHRNRGGFLVVTVSNASRAIPTFAVLILAVVAFGFGFTPNVLALTLFAVPPILANAYVGMVGVDRDAKEAARGMGMSERQLLTRVEMPLALPLIAAGIRTSTVQVIATATLAAYVGSGGLGRYIRDGFAVRDLPAVFGGALLVALLALLAEFLLARLQGRLTPGRGAPARPGGTSTPGGGDPGGTRSPASGPPRAVRVPATGPAR